MSLATFHQSCRQLESGTDEHLKNYYVKTSAVSDISKVDSVKTVCVGLKGVGKTAAYRFLTDSANLPGVIVGLTHEDYSVNLPNRGLDYSACMKQFEHDLVMEGLRAVTQDPASAKKIGKSLLSAAEKQLTSYVDILKKYLARFQGLEISLLGCGFTLPSPERPVAFGLRKERDLKEARQVLKDICAAGVKIHIVVDDPEHVFSITRELDVHLVGGFCLAALRLGQEIPGFKAIPLFKTHVYFPLLRSIDDLGKYPDHMARLAWSTPELVQVIADRMRWADISWKDVFAGTEKDAQKLLNFMCEKIRNGPRDLLRWIDLSLQNTKEQKITETAVKATKTAIALHSFRELEAAHAGSYPRIRSVLKAIFAKVSDRQFTLPELKKHVLDLKLKDPEMMAVSRLEWMQLETAETLPELLFQIGALMLVVDSKPILPYEEAYDNENFEAATKVAFVPALREAVA